MAVHFEAIVIKLVNTYVVSSIFVTLYLVKINFIYIYIYIYIHIYIYIYIYIYTHTHTYTYMFGWVLGHINSCRLFILG